MTLDDDLTPDSTLAISPELYVRDRMLNTTSLLGVSGSSEAEISSDGRYLVFLSVASNQVAGDTNNVSDVFVRNLAAGTTTRVSVATSGAEAKAGSFSPSISADGRYVAFMSNASNLVIGDTNNRSDVFVRDLVTSTTVRASVASSGARGNGRSSGPSISPDGRYVAFLSEASNLVPGDANGFQDVFGHELAAHSFDYGLLKAVVPGGCLSVTGTVTLSDPAPPGGVLVSLDDSLAAASVPTTVKILAGAKSRNFVVNTKAVALDESGFVNATVAGVTKGQDLRVRRIGLSSVTVTPSTVVGGHSIAGKATL